MMVSKAALLALGSLVLASNVNAAEYRTNVAQMQAMDKITGRVSVVEVPVGGEVKFGTFSIVVRDCKTRPPEEIPENFAFVDVTDTDKEGNQVNIFKGWMISSSPALNAVEHPIYDAWLLKCVNGKVEKSKLLSSEQLAERDALPMVEREEPQDVGMEEPLIPEDVVIEEVSDVEATSEEGNLKEVGKTEKVIVEEVSVEGGPQALFNIQTEEDFSINEEPLEAEEEAPLDEDSTFLNLDASTIVVDETQEVGGAPTDAE